MRTKEDIDALKRREKEERFDIGRMDWFDWIHWSIWGGLALLAILGYLLGFYQ